MEKNIINNPSVQIPSERRVKPKEGKLDDLGFFRTQNGSFWDYDDEYFNRYGYDIHGGSYNSECEYLPGPTWLSDLGCYPEDADKYKDIDLNKLDDEMFDEGMDIDEAYIDDFKGDFECEDGEEDIPAEELAKMYLGGDNKEFLKAIENYTGMGIPIPTTTTVKPQKTKKNKKTKPKKKPSEDDEGWETVEEDEDI
jgi:hypothetical protein